MIQRIQSLLLLFAFVCLAVACFIPIGTITTDTMYYSYSTWTLHENIPDGQTIYSTFILGILDIILAVLGLVCIFLYKKRMVQSKICMAGVLLNLIVVILMLWIYPDILFAKIPAMENQTLNTQYGIGAFLPIISIALFYFANKFIVNDEKKVRAADRLR